MSDSHHKKPENHKNQRSSRLKVLALAPYLDGTDVGEAFCAYEWVKNLAEKADVTLLAMERPNRESLADQLPGVRVISKMEPAWARRHERLNAMAKLSYPGFYFWACREIKKLLQAGEVFDIAHQFSPFAIRYPSPLRKFDLPYVIGPLCGSIATPKAFQSECHTSQWFTSFRHLDRIRMKFDPFLRASFKKAGTVLGVAPYVADFIGRENVRHFEVISELGITGTEERLEQHFQAYKGIRLLHVGRGVRTKGLRDTIRALAHLSDLPGLHLDVAGQGAEIDYCQQMAAEMGVSEQITFHGQISRAAVDRLYRQADIFCFPSFREPSGSVIFEALSYGLPIIAADIGGPGHVIDDSCGFKIPPSEPEQFAADIAEAIQTLVRMPVLRHHLSKGAYAKVRSIGLWPGKIDHLLKVYQRLIPDQLLSDPSGTEPSLSEKGALS